ncbi:hypothetical protein RUM44_003150 [Polyplax serrata]|uniref:Uncharacterized protein n=1 Tax=Polyplax serrata TaxID=468196 RepID=A0ABR1AZI2_POLSC
MDTKDRTIIQILTISAVPRPRTEAHLIYKPPYSKPYQGDLPKAENRTFTNSSVKHSKIIHETAENGKCTAYRVSNGNQHSAGDVTKHGLNGTYARHDDGRDKKKEKKWTLGGLFKRRVKKDADDSSDDESADDVKGGFLTRRLSKREKEKEKRKLKARSAANGFDVIIPQTKKQTPTNGVGTTVEELWSGKAKSSDKSSLGNVATSPMRFIQRHPTSIGGSDLSTSTKDYLAVPKHSRSSSCCESVEGKKTRKEVLARAEAKRDLICDESSSDEYESHHSSSSLNRMGTDGHRRYRRIDRQTRRCSSRDDLNHQRHNELRNVKSDFEINCPSLLNGKLPVPQFAACNPLASNLMNHSESSSPTRSPCTKEKKRFLLGVPITYPTSTFPPSVHQFQQPRKDQAVGTTPINRLHTNGLDRVHHKQLLNVTDTADYLPNFPRSVSVTGSSTKPTVDEEYFPLSTVYTKEKSMSYDQGIHRAPHFRDRSLENPRQVPARWSVVNGAHSENSNTRRHKLLEMFRNEEKTRREFYGHQIIPRACETYTERAENRTDSTPSLSTQPGNFPQQPTQIVQRSASGNSFCNSRNLGPNRSNSYQHIPSYIGRKTCSQGMSFLDMRNDEENSLYWRPRQADTPTLNNDSGTCSTINSLNKHSSTLNYSPSRPSVNDGSSILRYYADQNPRSRNPIHVTCKPASPAELSYLSDSQVGAVKPEAEKHSRNPVKNASDFWKLKDQEVMLKNSFSKKNTSKSFGSIGSDKPGVHSHVTIMTSVPNGKKPVQDSEVTSNPNETEIISLVNKVRNDELKICTVPPELPVRRLSKREVLAKLHKCEQLKIETNELSKTSQENSNLDDALNELEVIYNSLRFKGDDVKKQGNCQDSIQKFYSEKDVTNNQRGIQDSESEQSVSPRGASVSDRVADDMAFRRLNNKERQDPKKFPSPCYLRSSPALFPLPIGVQPRKESPVGEPDITYDDVVFRNIRHANSTLRIQDPQPPFGIPIGVITPAPNSDYLHATPIDRFRPTFAPSKTPDIVKDDLAFRNLRKDHRTFTDQSNVTKKRAVRSLSANIYNIMQKEESSKGVRAQEVEIDVGKTQSLTDLTNGACTGKQALEKRLKLLKDEKNLRRAEFFEMRKKGGADSRSWTELGNFQGDTRVVPNSKMKLFDSRLCSGGNLIRPDNMQEQTNVDSKEREKMVERKSIRSPIVELSKYPAAAPMASLQGNPFKDTSGNPTVDEEQLENLLSALAIEAKNTSKDLERQLDELDTKDPVLQIEASAKNNFGSEVTSIQNMSTSSKQKRHRNLSLDTTQPNVECRSTGSLERNKSKWKSKGDCDFLQKSKRRSSKTDFDVEESNKSKNLEPVLTTNNSDVFQEVYEYNCNLPSANRRKSLVKEDVEPFPGRKNTIDEGVPDVVSDVELEFEKLHQDERPGTAVPNETSSDFGLVDDLIADMKTTISQTESSCASFPLPEEPLTRSESGAAGPSGSNRGEGEVKKTNLRSDVWLACSYALALAFYLQEIDPVTAVGIVLAVISIVAILIL